MKKLTKEEFIQKAQKIHGNLYDYSKVNYINSRTRVCIICPIHGEFLITPNNHLKGVGCSKCNRICYDTESFIKEANKIHKEKYLYNKTEFVNTHTKVLITCKEHGDFEQLPLNHLHGEGCIKCKYAHQNDLTKSSTQEFIKKAEVIHHNFYKYDKVNYLTNRTKVLITCPKHGDFWQEPHEHLVGYGCKKCICKTQTKLFHELLQIVPDLEYEVTKSTVPWIQNLRLDMYSPMYNFAVECDGDQHFKPISIFGGEQQFEQTKQRDSLKNDLCKQNKCKLFRIKAKYTVEELNNLKQQIETFINLYQYESK